MASTKIKNIYYTVMYLLRICKVSAYCYCYLLLLLLIVSVTYCYEDFIYELIVCDGQITKFEKWELAYYTCYCQKKRA